MSRHSERASLALAHMSEIDPALSALSLWCDHRDSDTTTRSDGDTVYYGAEFPTRPLPEQVGLAAKHVFHIALRHGPRMTAMAARMGDRFDKKLFALAADALVNETLIAAGHAVPRPCPRLPQLLARIGAPADSAALAHWDVERLYLAAAAAGPAARAYADETRFEPDIAAGEAAEEGDAKAADWKGRLSRALEVGREAGRGVGATGVPLADMTAASTPWEILLRRLTARAVDEAPRRSHRRPARRWVAMEAEARRSGFPVPVFEPGEARNRRRPRIAVGLDTSSSVTDAQLALLASEVAGIARRSGAETHVLGFDELVHAEARLPSGGLEAALRSLPLRRGGGTSFVDVIERTRTLDPAILIMLTDLEGEFGPRPPFPVLWATTQPDPTAPPFGHLVSMAR